MSKCVNVGKTPLLKEFVSNLAYSMSSALDKSTQSCDNYYKVIHYLSQVLLPHKHFYQNNVKTGGAAADLYTCGL